MIGFIIGIAITVLVAGMLAVTTIVQQREIWLLNKHNFDLTVQCEDMKEQMRKNRW